MYNDNKKNDAQIADFKIRRMRYTFAMSLAKRALTFDGSELNQKCYDMIEEAIAEKYHLPENSVIRTRYKDLSEDEKAPQP